MSKDERNVVESTIESTIENAVETATEKNIVPTGKKITGKNGTEKKEKFSKTHENDIDKLRKQLETQLKKISRKNEIAKNREKFLETKENLEKMQERLKEDNVFDCDYVTITFKATQQNGYSSDSFLINNKVLIDKFILSLIQEIDNKVKEIECELIRE